MVSLDQFIIYAYIFNDFFRLSAVFGFSSGMYVKLYFSAIASFIAFLASILLLAKSRKQPAGMQTFLLLSAATFAGGISTLTVAIASYSYIITPSLFTSIPATTFILYRIHFASIPMILLFFWLFFSQLIRIRKVFVYLVTIISLLVLVVNSVTTITAEEVQLVLSVNMDMVPSLLTLILWLGAFIIIAISFYYYASKQKDERRIMGSLLGTAAVSAIMVQVSNIFALLLNNTILEAGVWIFAALAFTLMYFGLLPPKRFFSK
ncbi:MAG: hypothetical protein ACUVXA_09120 [Candidatus Jordarchaeum sp.]|uniref:hypothetical protein n=1 Tax=Candidatus Jordarchaeum sp. TaxID=2823881 RepID=UPI0040493CC2